jgi:hypothetical protein
VVNSQAVLQQCFQVNMIPLRVTHIEYIRLPEVEWQAKTHCENRGLIHEQGENMLRFPSGRCAAVGMAKRTI